MAQNGVDNWANLGDIFYGPLGPAGTYHLLKDLNIPAVSGNEDTILLKPAELGFNPTFEYTAKSLGTDGIGWLKALPGTTW